MINRPNWFGLFISWSWFLIITLGPGTYYTGPLPTLLLFVLILPPHPSWSPSAALPSLMIHEFHMLCHLGRRGVPTTAPTLSLSTSLPRTPCNVLPTRVSHASSLVNAIIFFPIYKNIHTVISNLIMMLILILWGLTHLYSLPNIMIFLHEIPDTANVVSV